MKVSGRRSQFKTPHVCFLAVSGHSSVQGWSDPVSSPESKHIASFWTNFCRTQLLLREQEDMWAFPESLWGRWGRSVSSPANMVEECVEELEMICKKEN